MTRSELIANLGARFPHLSGQDADVAVRVILDTMIAALGRGNRMEFRGFGSFQVNYRPERVGRNPRTGQSVMVPAKHVAHFKPGKVLREGVTLGG